MLGNLTVNLSHFHDTVRDRLPGIALSPDRTTKRTEELVPIKAAGIRQDLFDGRFECIARERSRRKESLDPAIGAFLYFCFIFLLSPEPSRRRLCSNHP